MNRPQNPVRKPPKVGEIWINRAANCFAIVAKVEKDGAYYIVANLYEYRQNNLDKCSMISESVIMGTEFDGSGYSLRYMKLANNLQEFDDMR